MPIFNEKEANIQYFINCNFYTAAYLISVWPDVRIKSSPNFPKVAKNLVTAFFTEKVCFSKQHKKPPNGYSWKKICRKELSKIAQNGQSFKHVTIFN